MNNQGQTQRIDRIVLDTDESNCATLIVLKEQKISSSVVLDSLLTIIGRDAQCTIALSTDSEVSRQHARIRIGLTADGTRQYFLSDLGSTNGTFLNSKRLEPNHEVMLTDGDKFIIGQHLFKFAVLDQSNEKFMSGNLSQISLFDLIQTIENNRLTCILILRSASVVGRLYLNLGQIADCDVDSKPAEGKAIDHGIESKHGLEAFRKLVTIQEGYFEVEKCETPFPQNIQSTGNMNLILDTLREIDEENAGKSDETDQ